MEVNHIQFLQKNENNHLQKKIFPFATRLLHELLPYKLHLILLISLTALASVLSLFPPLLLQLVIDIYMKTKDITSLILILVGFTALGLLMAAQSYFRQKLSQYIFNTVIKNLRNKLFEHISYLPFEFFDQANTGDLTARITSDTEQLKRFLNQGVINCLISVFTLIGVLIIIFIWNYQLGLIFIGLFPIIIIGLRFYIIKVLPANREARQTNASVISAIQETFNGIREIKLYGREEFMFSIFQKWNEHYFKASISANKYSSIWNPFTPFILNIFSTIFLLIGGMLAIGQTLTIGELIAVVAYFSLLAGPISGIVGFVGNLNNARAAGERVFETLDHIPSITNAADAIPLETVQGYVDLQDVHFGYDAHNEILKGISLFIHPGERVALVGPSGVGKTTLVNLIPRFYDVRGGAVLVDGINVKQYRIDTLRRQIGIVMQNVFLFDGTIADNIAYGNTNTTLNEIQNAARVAQLDDFIQKLPEGYNTLIGERGVRLSGGQAQRLSIARVLVTNPKILILDEPTANVDATTDKKLIASLRAIMAGRTTIIIAHRLQTIKDSDRIILLRDGKIEAQGTHEELVTANPSYREFFTSQFQKSDVNYELNLSSSVEDINSQPVRPIRGRDNETQGSGAERTLRMRATRNQKNDLKQKDYQFLLPFVKSHWKRILTSFILTVLNTLCAFLPPLLIRIMLDTSIPQQDVLGVGEIAILLFCFYTIIYVLSFSQSRISMVTGQSILRNLRESIFHQFLAYPLTYYEGKKRGELLSVITNNTEILSSVVTFSIISLISTIFSITILAIIMLILNPILGLIVCTLVPTVFLGTGVYQSRLRRNFFEMQKQIAKMTASVEENVSGIRVTQALAVENRNVQGFNTISQETFRLRMQAVRLEVRMNTFVSIMTLIGYIVLLIVGGYWYIMDFLTLGTLIAFMMFIDQFITPLQGLPNIINSFLEAGAVIQHIRKTTENVITIHDPIEPTPLPDNVQGKIELNNLHFRYVPSVSLYEGLNLTIEAHTKTGIIGETGAGKTTLINLITRLYEVNTGSIKIDGIDIRDLRQQDLRSIIAIVSQNVFLFADTIFNNIKFSRPTARNEEVFEAARLARAAPFIELMPRKYETLLGDTGVGLSGGQRQLIAYARMILAQPKIAILDEATSNIDPYTENLIQQNMDEALPGITLLIITHRFTTLKRVNRIVILRHGVIEATGNHKELMLKNNYYRKLFDKQYPKF